MVSRGWFCNSRWFWFVSTLRICSFLISALEEIGFSWGSCVNLFLCFFFSPISKIQFLWDWPQGRNCCPFSLPATHLTLIHQTNGSFGKTVRLYCLMFSLPFKTHNYTQWAPLGNGALKLNKNSQLIKSNVPKVALLFCEPHTQVKPDEMYSTRCLYLPLNALQPWKEGVDGREETGWGTCMPFHTGRQMVQCWCNSVLRR